MKPTLLLSLTSLNTLNYCLRFRRFFRGTGVNLPWSLGFAFVVYP